MICPECKKEHNEWHGNKICFDCATLRLIDKAKEIKKHLGDDKNEKRV